MISMSCHKESACFLTTSTKYVFYGKSFDKSRQTPVLKFHEFSHQSYLSPQTWEWFASCTHQGQCPPSWMQSGKWCTLTIVPNSQWFQRNRRETGALGTTSPQGHTEVISFTEITLCLCQARQAHINTHLHGDTTTHTHTQEDAKVAATYFSGFQQDLSLLLVLPLLLDSLQLLKEAKLRANVCRLLIVLIILAWRQRENHCNSLQSYKFPSAMTAQILDTNLRTSGWHSVYLYMLAQRWGKKIWHLL